MTPGTCIKDWMCPENLQFNASPDFSTFRLFDF